jgi:iron(III) transport system substrate-binding protein
MILAAGGCADRAGGDDQLADARKLVIYSTTDGKAFQPVIDDFRALNPAIEIDYHELEAADLDRRFRAEELAKGDDRADLLLSSAMDLQVRLVNDGYGAPHRTANSAILPGWARWRDEALGFTFEPVVMVFNRRLMQGREIPASRPQLLDAVRADSAFWRGRIGTYDVTKSSVGYLVASQDARQSADFGAMAEAFREAGVVTAGTTSEILGRLERGELAVGYNVLGSYARARAERSPGLEIVYPSDYTLAVARTAVIPKSAPHAVTAHQFLDYLLSVRGQRVLTNKSRLSAVRPEVDGRYTRFGITETSVGPLRPIALGPGLLVYLDDQKRERLLALWAGSAR